MTDTMLVPPQLPPFLATIFDLQPIAGVPSVEEVKLVHGAIKTLNTLLHTPELQGSNLPMELSQYLFDAQMVCYREKHPNGSFPNDIIYTPPDLPAHVPVKLEPVVGPPSDDQLRSAHTALRTLDSFSNVASLFDADLSMQLSQHVFDLQLARHIQRPTGGQPSGVQLPPQNRGSARTSAPGSRAIDEPDTSQVGGASQGGATPGSKPDSAPRLNTGAAFGNGQTEPQESTKVLVEIRETLKDVIKVLVASQNSLAKGFNSSRRAPGDGYSFGAHSLINEKGETPEMQGLPTIKSCSWYYEDTSFVGKLSTTILAQYFQFYGIGSELIEEGIVPSIKPGKEEDARKLLIKRLCVS